MKRMLAFVALVFAIAYIAMLLYAVELQHKLEEKQKEFQSYQDSLKSYKK